MNETVRGFPSSSPFTSNASLVAPIEEPLDELGISEARERAFVKETLNWSQRHAAPRAGHRVASENECRPASPQV